MLAKTNRPFWAVLSNPHSRPTRLRQSWGDVGKVFIVALILDSIYQVVVHAGIFTLELVVTATLLALVPYVVSRGLVTRIARWAGVGNRQIARWQRTTKRRKANSTPPRKAHEHVKRLETRLDQTRGDGDSERGL